MSQETRTQIVVQFNRPRDQGWNDVADLIGALTLEQARQWIEGMESRTDPHTPYFGYSFRIVNRTITDEVIPAAANPSTAKPAASVDHSPDSTGIRHTQQEWLRCGTLVYALESCGYRSGTELFRNRFSASFQSGDNRLGATIKEIEANAQLAMAAPKLLQRCLTLLKRFYETVAEMAAHGQQPDAEAAEEMRLMQETVQEATGLPISTISDLKWLNDCVVSLGES